MARFNAISLKLKEMYLVTMPLVTKKLKKKCYIKLKDNTKNVLH